MSKWKMFVRIKMSVWIKSEKCLFELQIIYIISHKPNWLYFLFDKVAQDVESSDYLGYEIKEVYSCQCLKSKFENWLDWMLWLLTHICLSCSCPSPRDKWWMSTIVLHNSLILLVLCPEQNCLKQWVKFLTKIIFVLTCTWNVSIMPSNGHPKRQAWLCEEALEPNEDDIQDIFSEN